MNLNTILALLAAGGLALTHTLAWLEGSNRVHEKWQAEKTAAQLVVAHAQKQQAEAAVKVVTKYVDRIRTVEGKTREIEKLIPVYLPADGTDCRLSAGFRLLHDAAASGDLLPATPGPLDDRAGQVEPASAAKTVSANYGACLAWREQLIGLQDWVASSGHLRPVGLPTAQAGSAPHD